MQSLLVFTLTALGTPDFRPASVAPVALEDLVRFSDVIVLGHVERVSRVARTEPSIWAPKEGEAYWDTWEHLREIQNEMPVAALVVDRVLSGPADLKRVHYLACGTWMCDSTGATEGERGLYFLSECDVPSLLPGFLGAIGEVTSGAPFYLVSHAGRGRMTSDEETGPTRVRCWDDVVLGEELLAASGHHGRYRFIHFVPLDLLEAAVRKFVSAQLPSFHVTGPSRGPSAPAWQLWVWTDGVLAGHVDDRWLEPRKAQDSVDALVKAFEMERFLDLPPTFGTAKRTDLAIVIEQHTMATRHRVVIGEDVLEAEDAQSEELARALRVYIAARTLLMDAEASGDWAEPIDAAVLEVDHDLQTVVLDKGQEDGARVGYTFHVYRGKKYKGTVLVTEVRETTCSARIADVKSPIAVGDSATTVL